MPRMQLCDNLIITYNFGVVTFTLSVKNTLTLTIMKTSLSTKLLCT